MNRVVLMLLLAGFSMAHLGCGGSSAPQGKELEDMQKQSQKVADDEEKAYQKEQKKKK